MQRALEPELLDSLPHDHPDALHNRRDLRVINRLMGNHRWIARTLPRVLRPGEHALELGAGTGELGYWLTRRGVRIAGLDRWPRPASWPAESAWHRADLRHFEGYPAYAAIVGNLIFHQFSDAELRALGQKLHGARVIIACEPQRRKIFQRLYPFVVALTGANHVSRHDGHVSIAAGFRAKELPCLLSLEEPEWDIRARSTLLGGYRMVAVRKSR